MIFGLIMWIMSVSMGDGHVHAATEERGVVVDSTSGSYFQKM